MNTTAYQDILNKIHSEVQEFFGQGKKADYIPALAKVPANKFAMSVYTIEGKLYTVGDTDEPFSIQSISKLITLTLALEKHGDEIWQRVGREPSGNAFNSLIQLENENGIPRNPFINAGALVITDMIIEPSANTKSVILNWVRKLSTDPSINYDVEVADSERIYGHRNRALANFIKSFGNLKNSVDDVTDLYFYQCSLAMSTTNLAKTFIYLANQGRSPLLHNERIVQPRMAKRLNALMLTCGMYDAVGDFAYWVGMPGKSGVGGGIVGIIPGLLSVAVWSPELDEHGNSLLGTKALELFTTYTNQSIF